MTGSSCARLELGCCAEAKLWHRTVGARSTVVGPGRDEDRRPASPGSTSVPAGGLGADHRALRDGRRSPGRSTSPGSRPASISVGLRRLRASAPRRPAGPAIELGRPTTVRITSVPSSTSVARGRVLLEHRAGLLGRVLRRGHADRCRRRTRPASSSDPLRASQRNSPTTSGTVTSSPCRCPARRSSRFCARNHRQPEDREDPRARRAPGSTSSTSRGSGPTSAAPGTHRAGHREAGRSITCVAPAAGRSGVASTGWPRADALEVARGTPRPSGSGSPGSSRAPAGSRRRGRARRRGSAATAGPAARARAWTRPRPVESPTNGGRPVDHLVEHAAERVDVGAPVDGLALRLLRRQVRRGAEDRRGLRDGLGRGRDARDPEVRDLHLAVRSSA